MKTKTSLIALSREDGGVSIMVFVVIGRGNILPFGAEWLSQVEGTWLRPETDANIEHEIEDMKLIDPTSKIQSWRRIDPSEIPTDRTYRNAWTDTGNAIEHDMVKARAIHLAKLRRKRDAKLVESDGQMLRAIEEARDQVDLRALRQAWRDFPMTSAAAFEAASNIDELKAIQLPE